MGGRRRREGVQEKEEEQEEEQEEEETGPRGGAVGPQAVVPVQCRTWRETQYRACSPTLQSIATRTVSNLPLYRAT